MSNAQAQLGTKIYSHTLFNYVQFTLIRIYIKLKKNVNTKPLNNQEKILFLLEVMLINSYF